MLKSKKEKKHLVRTHFSRNKRPQPLQICTLSGLDEIGRNSNFIEYKGKILIVDMGFSFPGEKMHGIDYLIPNINYLKKNRDRIVGILITHGHLDHTGALPYVLEDLGFPTIYGGKFGNALIKQRLAEFKLLERTKIVDIERSESLRIGPFKATFIGVTHSIPNSFSIFVETDMGNVFFSGDYKIDQAPANEPESDYRLFKSLRGKVDIALMESTNAYEEGKSVSAQEVENNLNRVISSWKGRIVVAMFSSLVSRLYSVLKIAEDLGRKVAVSGRSLKASIQIAQEQGYIRLREGTLIDEADIKKYADHQILFITTGSQAERYSALNRISLNEHKYFKVKKGDLVILSSSEIPGNMDKILSMTDRLIRLGAEIVKGEAHGLHETGHGMQIDMKMMYEMVRPRWIIPIHGSLTFRYQNKKNYIKWGMPANRVMLSEDGQLWKFDKKTLRKGVRIESKPILIDGLGIGDIGDSILNDREKLANYGVLCVVLNLTSKNKRLLGKPKFISRGFINVKTSAKLLSSMEGIVRTVYKSWYSEKHRDTRELRKSIEKQLSRHILKKIEREPIILPIII